MRRAGLLEKSSEPPEAPFDEYSQTVRKDNSVIKLFLARMRFWQGTREQVLISYAIGTIISELFCFRLCVSVAVAGWTVAEYAEVQIGDEVTWTKVEFPEKRSGFGTGQETVGVAE